MTRTFRIEESGFPDLPQMMLATLDALRSIGGSASLHELDERVVEAEGVTEAEQAHMMPDGKYPRLNYYLAWARTFLKRGGALENSARGVWRLTETGAPKRVTKAIGRRQGLLSRLWLRISMIRRDFADSGQSHPLAARRSWKTRWSKL